MHGFVLFAGVEALLLFLAITKLKELRRLEREIHSCAFDLALALTLASKGRYDEAHACARQWADRMRAFKRGERWKAETAPPPPRLYRTGFAP